MRAGVQRASHLTLELDIELARAIAVATALSLLSQPSRASLARGGVAQLDALVSSAEPRDQGVLQCLASHLRLLDLARRSGVDPAAKSELRNTRAFLWWPSGPLPGAYFIGGGP